MKGIAVLGAGSYGTALAIQLARRGTPVWLWGRDRAALAAMQEQRINQRYLPEAHFPIGLTATSDLRLAIESSEELLIAVPSHALRETLRKCEPLLLPGQGIACAMKGIETGTGKLVHEVVGEELGETRDLAVISGPTFAKELGLGLPTAVTVASSNLAYAERIAHALHGDGFRAYTAADVIGVEIGGAVKNVLAIAVGIADGLGLGANTRAALITRGLAEIMRLGESMGAKPETLMGLSGLGDLVLTCTDNQSRNRRMGLLLAQGKSVTEATAEIRQVVEGVRVAPEVRRLAEQRHVSMPITEQVCRVLLGEISAVEAVRALATRPAKPENH
ncbi:MAG: NAD(P)-dependent glycerol-3-phosphate dehydrogenase [Hydrocarboniphaga sp.]|uniref:NAD(P)H-dependent glycerol-3-phosphate dehydrogenase n=1 Tax=Hydrocarboniphaga sp. TaxID=2033016 RepID=UPI002602CA40|nr:NAD(P)H-dependent glycerol-3-phosphate dehydrogenase [Hydrocarboniphaga sp.]MDB5972056.1 NAD(P)-dependent glycerol-3-phosphate dehydrogenase [Hydrocarboniphaga sp.]